MHLHTPPHSRRHFEGLLLLLALTLAGCASQPQKMNDRPAEEIVRERAQERLDMLLTGELEKAWAYTTPSYRQRYDYKAYAALVGGTASWTVAQVDKVQCEKEACDVRVMISYKLLRHKMENTRPVLERWIKVDGEWWIFHRGR